VYNGKPLRRDDTDGLERVAQYIIRNPFSEQKMTYNEESGTVIYRSRMHAKTKRNFEIFSAEEFILLRRRCAPGYGGQVAACSVPRLACPTKPWRSRVLQPGQGRAGQARD
jgi:hypothetical protein